MSNLRRIGFNILLFLFLDVLFCTVVLSIGLNVTAICVPMAFCLSYAITYFLLPVTKKRYELLHLMLLFLLFAFTVILYKGLYSYDLDGNQYHKMAIGLLRNGWNPFKESASVFGTNFFGAANINTQSLWIDHYPKATFLYGASVYAIIGSIEYAKSYQVFVLLAVFCIILPYFKVVLNSLVKALLLSIALCFNPIVVLQLFSFYTDGVLSLLFILLLVSLLQMVDYMALIKTSNSCWLSCAIVIFCTFNLMSNIRFTGLVYACITMFVYVLYFCIKCKKSPSINVRAHIELFIYCVLSSVFIVGAPTYLKNTIDHHNPFYPELDYTPGLGWISFDSNLMDNVKGFTDNNSLVKFFHSVFSEVTNYIDASESTFVSRLKIPFTITKEELSLIPSEDLFLSGLGVFFSGLLILSILVIAYGLISKSVLTKDKKLYIGLNCALFVGLLTITLSRAWRMRYVPQLYFIVVLAYAIILLSKKKLFKILLPCFTVLLLFNNFFFVTKLVDTYTYSKNITEMIATMKERPVVLDISKDSCGNIFDMQDADVEYQLLYGIGKANASCNLQEWRYQVPDSLVSPPIEQPE